MRALRVTIAMAGLVALGGLGTACDNELSCKTAMRNFYAAGCMMTIQNPDVQLLDQGEARDWCESAETRAVDCGCEDLHLALIDCLFMVDTAACYDCDQQLADFQLCANTCVL